MKTEGSEKKQNNVFTGIPGKRVIRFLAVVTGCALIISAGYIQTAGMMFQTRLRAQKDEIERSGMTMELLLKESINAVQMASYTLGEMMSDHASKEEMHRYLVEQTETFSKSVDEQFDGLYALIDDVYLDGLDWVPPEGFEPKERPWYKKAIEAKGAVALVAPYLDAETNRIVISVCCMLPDRKSVVALDQFLDLIQKQVEKEALKNDWDLCMVVDEQGFVVAHSDPSFRGTLLDESEEPVYQAIRDKITEAETGSVKIRAAGRKYRLFSVSVENDWHIVALISEQKMRGGLQYYYLLNLLTILMVVTVLLVILYRQQKERHLTDETRKQYESITNIYTLVYLIDLQTDTWKRIAEFSPLFEDSTGKGREKAQHTVRAILDTISDTRFKAAMFEFSTFSTLNERMRGKNTITREFINNNNRRYQSRFVVVERDKDGKIIRVIWTLERIDERGGMQLV